MSAMEIDSPTPAGGDVRKLGPYIVGPTLGVGGFSKVRLGIHEITKEKVALKILKKDKLSQMSSSTKRQVEREISAMQKIQHVNVIGMKAVDWECTYIKKNGKAIPSILVVLELATGGELFEFLSFTGCFEESIARTYFHQLVEGIGFCHSKGVAHRDLKPENLLLNDDFVLKLADFGFSNVFGESGSERMMYTECGTPGYMAPEMFKGGGYDATCADVWACGVILFIMLAGFPPIQKPNTSDWWFHKLLTNKHALFWQAHSRNAYFSEPTKDLINKILQPDPTKRITIQQITKHPWYLGPTISHQALMNELRRRKRTVDEQKNREALEKKQQRAIAAAGPGATPVQTITDRDLTPGSEGGGLLSGFRDGLTRSMEDGSESTNDAAPQPYDATISCYTQFETEAKPRLVLQRLEGFMNRIPQVEFSSKESEYKIKAIIPTGSGPLNIIGQVFGTENKTCMVQFRRLNGDGIQYRALYNLLRKDVAAIIKEQKREAGDTEVDPQFEKEAEKQPEFDPESDMLPDASPEGGATQDHESKDQKSNGSGESVEN